MKKKYAKDLITAIAHLHLHGVQHRDLKLEKINKDKQGNLKFFDLGGANIASCRQRTNSFNLTSTEYCHPYTRLAEKKDSLHFLHYSPFLQSAVIDCFSLGAILFSILAATEHTPHVLLSLYESQQDKNLERIACTQLLFYKHKHKHPPHLIIFLDGSTVEPVSTSAPPKKTMPTATSTFPLWPHAHFNPATNTLNPKAKKFFPRYNNTLSSTELGKQSLSEIYDMLYQENCPVELSPDYMASPFTLIPQHEQLIQRLMSVTVTAPTPDELKQYASDLRPS